MVYSLEPLHSNPELIDDTIGLLKEGWPECLAERLRIVETSQCSGLPCSLVLTERSQKGAAKEVLGHVRIVRASPEKERRVNLESAVIKKSRRKEGLGRKLHDLVEDYAKMSLNARYIHVCVLSSDNLRFYQRLEYRRCPVYPPLIAANVLRTFFLAKWEGNIIPEEWTYLYDVEYVMSKEEMLRTLTSHSLVKDLEETTAS